MPGGGEKIGSGVGSGVGAGVGRGLGVAVGAGGGSSAPVPKLANIIAAAATITTKAGIAINIYFLRKVFSPFLANFVRLSQILQQDVDIQNRLL